MRYYSVPNATFVDWNGVSQALKDMREITMAPPAQGQKTPKYQQAVSCLGFTYVPMKTMDVAGASTFLDEIASRPEVYGDGHEDDAYLIFEMNMDAITSASFDFATVKQLVIPRKDAG